MLTGRDNDSINLAATALASCSFRVHLNHHELIATNARHDVVVAHGAAEPPATSHRKRSPTAWPSVSLMPLKLSMSMNITAKRRLWRRASATSWSRRASSA